jgi:quercetin dioxygenase-like cupin family protein
MTVDANNRLEPFVVEMGEGGKDIAANMLVRRLASAAQTGGEFSVIELSGVRGTGAGAHRHGNEAESFYILEGAIRVFVDEIKLLTRPGDFVYIPRNARHKFSIESAYGRFLCVMTPGGFEDFFTEMGRPTSDSYPPNPPFPPYSPPENFGDIAARFNWRPADDW